MPNTHASLVSLFEDIADAIRAKTGGSASIVADNFPTEIANIPAGGGGLDDGILTKTFSGTVSSTISGDLKVEFSYSPISGIDLPNITSIVTSNGCCVSCTSLQSVNMPSIVTVPQNTFKYCSALTTVSLPSAQYIRMDAFNGCTSLQSISLPSAKTIGNNAQSCSTFMGCTSLEEAYIGSGVSELYSHIFNGSSNLRRVTLAKTDGPVRMYSPASAQFNGTPIAELDEDAHIYVPASLVSTYQSTSEWVTFSSIISAIPNS